MSVIIKGMKMPTSCKSCDILQNYDGDMYCPLNDYLNFGDIENVPDYVMNGCPLVKLPEKHNRLVEFIDVATEINEDTGLEEINLGEAFAAYFKMRESKPVIEAEGEG